MYETGKKILKLIQINISAQIEMVNHKNRKNHRKYKSVSSQINLSIICTHIYMWLYLMSMDNLIHQKRNENKKAFEIKAITNA